MIIELAILMLMVIFGGASALMIFEAHAEWRERKNYRTWRKRMDDADVNEYNYPSISQKPYIVKDRR